MSSTGPLGSAVIAPAGIKGFDADRPIAAFEAGAFVKAGYRFALRYVMRETPHQSDASRAEVTGLLAAGLAVMLVQHVENDPWIPSSAKGTLYGTNAAACAVACGIPLGVTVWLDLEGVDPHVPAGVVIAYCNTWFANVADAGYTPGLYVGVGTRLSASQLYHALTVKAFWSAYNLNSDQVPAVRGVQMRQHAVKPEEIPVGVDIDGQMMDTDTIMADAKGETPTVCAPPGWLEALTAH